MQHDLLHRYIFEKLDARGELVQIERTFTEMLAGHDYPEPVKELLGELLVSTCLLTATLKFEGDIAVQLQGDGPVKYIVINGDNNQNMRGIARLNGEVTGRGVKQLIGNGYMVITLTPVQGERYQGVVPLDSDSLAECIETYFQQSEQLSTRLWLATSIEKDRLKASGLLLQTLPVTNNKTKSAEDFEHLEALSSTITHDELLNLDAMTLLTRLYHEDNPEVFEPQSIAFKCTCSRTKTMTALINVGLEPLLEDIRDKGQVTISCHYCLTDYTFNEEEVRSLF
ncbi:Hsp33 family molecular chaperone HslO [Pseudoalteromonas tunicata]|uniref:Hsp33 family molecular chaperone HslO n=1 Tax=Pseudoalteromonas tunicata TaxID=314281 RepID=UPI0027400C8B|nr:Hsp33 family molecular chaperone HslO [Pseudoalteromonas tunicata]MDP5213260.1 Hsp33 family molecular chaperone HslO [Pseudoalteromonas tunicata]